MGHRWNPRLNIYEGDKKQLYHSNIYMPKALNSVFADIPIKPPSIMLIEATTGLYIQNRNKQYRSIGIAASSIRAAWVFHAYSMKRQTGSQSLPIKHIFPHILHCGTLKLTRLPLKQRITMSALPMKKYNNGWERLYCNRGRKCEADSSPFRLPLLRFYSPTPFFKHISLRLHPAQSGLRALQTYRPCNNIQ